MSFPEIGFEAGTDEHDTPEDLFYPISRAVGGFDLDPCASTTSNLADQNITKDEDGLSMSWHGKVFMNPPYSEVSDWMEYAVKQHVHGHTDLLVVLVFARTSTQWWHNYATKADLYCFIEGRVRFGDADNSAPAPSVLLVYGDYPDGLETELERIGHVL